MNAKMLKHEDQLKRMGMDSCARHYRDQLVKAQSIAVELANKLGTVTSDDVREESIRRGLNLSFSKNWSGSVFRCKDWESCGFQASRHDGSHGHTLRVWKLKNQPKVAVPVPVQKQEKPIFKDTLFEMPKVIDYGY
jgi:hypothetical protein